MRAAVKPWKQLLAEMKRNVANIKTKVIEPFPGPCVRGVHIKTKVIEPFLRPLVSGGAAFFMLLLIADDVLIPYFHVLSFCVILELGSLMVSG
jgi:hypothetical protein